MAKSLEEFERWNGGYPGPHLYSDLENLQPDSQNEGLGEFLQASERLIEEWEGNQFTGLYLFGEPGTGKTHAAIGLARALHDAGADIFYRYGPELVGVRNRLYWSGSRYRSVKDEENGSIFPSTAPYIPRNPKTVLVFDDYVPKAQEPLFNAVDAAAQYGGMIIVTSNSTDPFKLFASKQPAPAVEAVVGQESGSVFTEEDRKAKLISEVSKRVMSRVGSGLKVIQFTGEDWRRKKSFWGNE